METIVLLLSITTSDGDIIERATPRPFESFDACSDFVASLPHPKHGIVSATCVNSKWLKDMQSKEK